MPEPSGYTYGTDEAARSPVSLAELDELRGSVGLTSEDEHYLRMAADVLSPQAEAMVDTWRGLIAEQPHLAAYSAHPDGRPNPEYSAASKPRFAQWIIDVCTRPYDQAWLDYQQEIGIRHTRTAKNRTDDADAPDHIPLRHLLAFTAPLILTTKPFLEGHGHSPDQVERMYAAWAKAVVLHVTLWARAYTTPANW
ncbi:hypothetical protein GCM10014715_82070 [Streptomyces spiralis]|uniref:Globin-sensor domain-containing protein n=1 Tax=Streptomyces spiralis TaxID=66376 RepID=A0A919AMM3_9ACTN|nr:protoglobin domain-containing protein [Streptomyces spiralis]GHF14217.1 hypothetical protein GCM10014715_82070 [Streptomyces spiralis]